MSEAAFAELGDFIQQEMVRLHVPGVALGVLHGETTHTAAFGVTSVEHPLPVTPDTLFQVGSISKTIAATAAMRLVEQGKLELDVPVRRYVPELRLADEPTAAAVTLRHLFTHTGGWTGDYFDDLGPGDDAVAKIVANMARLAQETPLGRYWSYNNAGFYLAGRAMEVTGGKPFDALIKELVFEPLGMSMSFFAAADCMTHRVAVGHDAIYGDSQEPPKVSRPWAVPRAAGPAGGVISTIHDLLRYARFQMGEGAEGLLAPSARQAMQTPYIPAANDESMGLTWFIRDVEGVRLLRHGGATNGQMATFQFAPARRFAITILTNSDRGSELYHAAVKRALESFLGITERDPEPMAASAEQLVQYAGRYHSLMEDLVLRMAGGELIVESIPLGGFPTPDSPPPPAPPPVRAALCGPDQLILLEEPAKGERGEFLRETDGSIAWLRMGSRLHARQA